MSKCAFQIFGIENKQKSIPGPSVLDLRADFHWSQKDNIYEINTRHEVLAQEELASLVSVIRIDVCLGRTGLWWASLRNCAIKREPLKGSSEILGFNCSSSVLSICLISFPASALSWRLNSEEQKPQMGLWLWQRVASAVLIPGGGDLFLIFLMPGFLLCPALPLTLHVSKTCVMIKTCINILEFTTKCIQ